MSSNIIFHDQSVTLEQREAHNGHKPAVLWFTGLSGSGKSTLAMALQHALFKKKSRSPFWTGTMFVMV